MPVGGALLGAFASFLFTQSIEKKKAAKEAANAAAETQRRLAKAEADRILVVRQACEQLRVVTDRWYKEIRTAIDPMLSPGSNVSKLHSLFQQKTYEGQIYNLEMIIKDEPACAPVIEAISIWTGNAFLIKDQGSRMNDGPIYYTVARDAALERFYGPNIDSAVREKALKDNPEIRDKYLKDLQDRLFSCYSGFDNKLNKAIQQLHEMESETRQKSLAGLETSQ